MRLRETLFAAAGIGAAPTLALLLLAICGVAATGPALLAVAGVAAAALGLALLWTRDLARFASALRRAAGDRAHTLPHSAGPRLPLLADLARGAERLLRAEATRAEWAQAAQRTDAEILERLPDPLIVLDFDFDVRRVNAAARREFGSEASSALRHPTLRAAIDRVLAEHAQQSAELMFPVPVPREFQATVTLLGPAPGNGVVILLADRTGERAVERMRADFVANAGHELRTPLASLIGFIDTLRGPAADDPAAQRRFLGIMAEQAARMHRLIDDLLGLSRIELIEHQRPIDRVDIAELAVGVAAGFEPALLSRKAVLAVEIDPALPSIVGDADQLAQVLQNLLENALKYGGDGVHIRLAAKPPRPDEHWPARPGVVLAVSDTGPGVAGEHLPRLTERFYRVDAGRSRAAGGTGLGLAIVKHIVNRHHGQLRIESTLGKGTTVRVWLPTT